MPESKPNSAWWADLAVFPFVAVLAVPALAWFGHRSWAVVHTDAPRYLFAASQLVTGQGLEGPSGASVYNGGHGPVFPALIGSLILLLGRDTETIAWALRLLALLNPLLAYFLAKRLSGPPAGFLAAALVTLFSFDVKLKSALNIDAALLTLYLSSVLALILAVQRGGTSAWAPLSGLLLGAAILTKETAIAGLPLALLAVLLIGWESRGALWHYLGVAAVALPWWAWVYFASGEIYLLGRLPLWLLAPAAVAAMLLGFGAVAAYATGRLDLLLSEEAWRRRTGGFVLVAWTISLSGMALATGSHELARVSLGSVGDYLTGLLAPVAIVVPVLAVVIGYVVWRGLGRDVAWNLFALTLLFQAPVCLLVVVQGWALRQFLVIQTLLLCALAVLVAKAFAAALGEAASSRNAYPVRVAGVVVAASLGILVLGACVERAQALLPDDSSPWVEQRTVAPQATAMVAWMDEHVPEGERVLVNAAQGGYMAYLDGGQREWTFLRLDQGICAPRPNAQRECDPDQNSISEIPPEAIWVQMIGRCKVVSLSMPNLLEQARRSGSDYVMITGSPVFPGIMALPSLLQESGAFEVVHAEGRSDIEGTVLLKVTGRAPRAVPTLLNRNAVLNLKRCERAKGKGYSKWSKSEFPNGIFEVTVSS